MPNGRGHMYHTTSLTLVGVGERGTEVVAEFAERSSDGNWADSATFNCVHLEGSEPTGASDDRLRTLRIEEVASGMEEKPYLDSGVADEGEPRLSAPTVRHYVDAEANFLPLFEHLESGVVSAGRGGTGEENRHGLHLNIVVGDVSTPLVRGTLPIVGKMLEEASDSVGRRTITAGALLCPTCTVEEGKSIGTQYRRAYVGLREASTLLVSHDGEQRPSIPIQSGVLPSGPSDLMLSDRVFDFFGPIGYLPEVEFGAETAVKGASVLSVLSEMSMLTDGYGVLHLPGAGWKGSAPEESRSLPDGEFAATPIPWTETYHSGFDASYWGGIDKYAPSVPVQYVEESPEAEKWEFVERDLGVYAVPKGGTADIEMAAGTVELRPRTGDASVQGGGDVGRIQGQRNRDYVLVHPDVDLFDVSPYAELHEQYADDLDTLLADSTPYPLAYPELVDTTEYTIRP